MAMPFQIGKIGDVNLGKKLEIRGPLQFCLTCLLSNPCGNIVEYRVRGLKDRSSLKIHILELSALS